MFKQKEFFIAIGVAFLLAILFTLLLPRLKSERLPFLQAVQVPAVQEPTGRHPLTGQVVYEDTGFPRVYGVMIDNHVEAWPQAGLDKAFLVFEAPVEAGISRFLAFFHEGQVIEKIGPVRSARPYFLDWNNELDALYVHVGGSDDALDLIASGGTFDLNEYWHATNFWRAYNRYAPHNTYTSTQRLGAYVLERKKAGRTTEPVYETWKFKDPAISQESDVNSITVSFDPPTYVVEWKLDASMNRYVRFQAGKAHTMEDGATVTADNIAVVVTDVEVMDSVGRRKVRTIGQGDAFVFMDGGHREAKWKKESQSGRLRFFDKQENELIFNSGVTFVEIIPKRDDVSW